MFTPYLKLMRFHKPIGTCLLLWPTLWALWFAAHGLPSMKNLMIFIGGVIVMRAAGCVINDFADRHFDKHVKRTKHRPLTSGEVTEQQTLILFAGLCLLALTLVSLTNILTIKLACLALLFAIIYPFMKRYTYWPQLFLGIAFSFSIPMAFAAETNAVPLLSWLLMFTNILWTIAYDTEYAMIDYKDDLTIGIKSTAILFGKYNSLIIGILQATMLLILITIGIWQSLSWVYYLSLVVAAGLMCYQQQLIYSQNTDNFFRAFLNNNWVGLIIFIGISLSTDLHIV